MCLYVPISVFIFFMYLMYYYHLTSFQLIASFTSKELRAYSMAGAVAEEILTSIRTVIAFNGQQKAIDKYVLCTGGPFT